MTPAQAIAHLRGLLEVGAHDEFCRIGPELLNVAEAAQAKRLWRQRLHSREGVASGPNPHHLDNAIDAALQRLAETVGS